MGVRTIGQALRLPRAGFAQRFGTEPLATLDRLTGRDPDLRERFRARERFRRKRDLTYELESHEAILRALEPLLRELGKFLQARQCGIMQLECLLQHRQAPPTSCVLRLAAPAADAGRLGELLAERLNRLVLPEPVRSCELRSGALVRSCFLPTRCGSRESMVGPSVWNLPGSSSACARAWARRRCMACRFSPGIGRKTPGAR